MDAISCVADFVLNAAQTDNFRLAGGLFQASASIAAGKYQQRKQVSQSGSKSVSVFHLEFLIWRHLLLFYHRAVIM